MKYKDEIIEFLEESNAIEDVYEQQARARDWFLANYLDGDKTEDAEATMINAIEALGAIKEIVARVRTETLDAVQVKVDEVIKKWSADGQSFTKGVLDDLRTLREGITGNENAK